MKTNSMWTLLVVLAATVMTTGCLATMPGPISEVEYLGLSPEGRSEYLAKRTADKQALEVKKDTEYDLGDPVHYGSPDKGFTLQWIKGQKGEKGLRETGFVSLCKGHTTGFFGIDTSLCSVARADQYGNLHLQKVGGVQKPTTLIKGNTSQKGMGRVLVEGGFKLGAGYLNGGYGAEVRADSCADGNCSGDTTLINAGANSSAAALSDAVSTSVTDFDAVFSGVSMD